MVGIIKTCAISPGPGLWGGREGEGKKGRRWGSGGVEMGKWWCGDGEVVVWRWGSGGVEMGSGGVEMGPHLFLHLLHDQLLHPGLGTCLVTQAMLRYKMTGRHIAKCNSSYHIQ